MLALAGEWPEPASAARLCWRAQSLTIKNSKTMTAKHIGYLFVERDDRRYDYKAGFASYTEADNYRQECQRRWINHRDYVYLWTGYERINLTKMPKDERNELLKQFNIPE